MGRILHTESSYYVYRLRKEDIATYLAIGKGDHNILIVYKHMDKMPMIAVLHHIIGRGAKCREEKHVEVIKELEKRLRIATRIAAAYLRKYGKIRPEKS